MRTVLAMAMWLGATAGLAHAEADLIIGGARILTQDSANPRAEAIAIKDGRIVALGSTADLLAERGAGTEFVDAAGATLLPGLIDSHMHPVYGAVGLDDCTLADKPSTVPEIAAVAKRCLTEHPPAKADDWLVIGRLNPAAFAADAKALDTAVADRPLALLGADGHTSWVNSKGLALTGITKDTPDPVGGRITRNADGSPTGAFIDRGQARLQAVLPKDDLETKVAATEQAFKLMAANGITGVMDAAANAETLEVYKRLSAAGKLSTHVVAALVGEVARGEASLAEIRALRDKYAGVPGLRVDTVKIFADGVIEFPTQSAALLAPYLDGHGKPTDKSGTVYAEPKAFAAFVTACAASGFNVHVHAIGDAAVRAALDAFEAARATDAGKKVRFSISHLQLIDRADWPRFKALDVYASFQLLWALPNNYSIEAVEPYIGAERMTIMYPAKGVADAGGIVAGGSDWSVSSFNPFEAMWVAHTRRSPQDPTRAPLVPEQAMPLDAMLRAYSLDAARMLGMDKDAGSLAVGKAADMVLIDRDPLDEKADLYHTKVVGTLIGGKWAYRAK